MTIYRNRKLLDLAREAPYCFRCRTFNVGQVVGAHSNSQAMGHGMGIKAADVPAFLCNECHDIVDGRRLVNGMTKEQREGEWAIAAARSMRWVLEEHPEVFR